MNIIIFDFNRTIYDPEKGSLLDQSLEVLELLRGKGFLLCLISTSSPSRQALIKNLRIRKYFEKIVISENKTIGDFKKIIRSLGGSADKVFVIGDRVKKEIKMGNNLGFITIWLKKGKFAYEMPVDVSEQPVYTINNLKEIMKIIN